MKLLDKRDMGVIYAIKKAEGEYEKSILNFMSKYTGTPIEVYTSAMALHLVEHAFGALMDIVDYPSHYILTYFRWKDGPWRYTDFEAMCAVLGCEVSVKKLNPLTKKYEYVNGFAPMEEFGYD